MFYTDISSSIQNNGWASEFFPLGRGVRQGCPLSPYLFVLCAEILGTAIRNHKQIKGIRILDEECKVSQYADDTTLILNGSDVSMQQSFYLLDSFAEISGLKVNYEKTEALWIGSLRLQKRIIAAYQNITWAFSKVNALGVWFSTIKEESLLLNYREKKEKISNLIENWQFRRLTLLRKIVAIKSLLASQLVYIMSPLPTSHEFLKDINSLFYKFLWNGKSDKIKRTQMINDYSNGGLRMLDIQSFNQALKAKWIQKYLDQKNKGKWKLFLNFFLAEHNAELIFTGNLKIDDIPFLQLEDPFSKELIAIWSNLTFKKEPNNFSQMPIWYNSLIRINNKPFYYRNWSLADIRTVDHLLDKDSKFLTFDTFKKKYSVKTNFLQYYSVVCAISELKNVCVRHPTLNSDDDTKNLMMSSKFCKSVYKTFVKRKASLPIESQNKWLLDFKKYDFDKIDWCKSCNLAFLCTRETKLQNFQFKLLHRRIATNSYLFKIGIIQSDLCSFCKENSETLVHFFWECPYVRNFWNEVKYWIYSHPCFSTENFSFPLCLGLVENISNLLFHHALLIARYHIYCSKSIHSIPSRELYIRNFHLCLDVERRYALKNGTLNKFNKKWGAFTRDSNL